MSYVIFFLPVGVPASECRVVQSDRRVKPVKAPQFPSPENEMHCFHAYCKTGMNVINS